MPCATPWFYCLVRRLLRFACFFYLYNILFFLSIIDNKINIKNKPELLCLRLLNITCLTILSPIIIINSKKKMVTNECLFMYHLLYQINKFKKIFGDKISYLIIVFHVTKGRKMIKLERCKLVMSLSKKRTL